MLSVTKRRVEKRVKFFRRSGEMEWKANSAGTWVNPSLKLKEKRHCLETDWFLSRKENRKGHF